MLDVDGGVNVDARAQQLLHILVALDMAAALGVGVGQLIQQEQLGMPRQCRVQIKFPPRSTSMWDRFDRQLFQPIQQSHGLRLGVGLDIARHHIHAGRLGPAGGFQHGVSLADAGGIAKEYFQVSGRRLLRLPDAVRQTEVRTALLQHGNPSSLRRECGHMDDYSTTLLFMECAGMILRNGEVRLPGLVCHLPGVPGLPGPVPTGRNAAIIQEPSQAVHDKDADGSNVKGPAGQ